MYLFNVHLPLVLCEWVIINLFFLIMLVNFTSLVVFGACLLYWIKEALLAPPGVVNEHFLKLNMMVVSTTRTSKDVGMLSKTDETKEPGSLVKHCKLLTEYMGANVKICVQHIWPVTGLVRLHWGHRSPGHDMQVFLIFTHSSGVQEVFIDNWHHDQQS